MYVQQFRHSTPLIEVNNAVDSRPLLLSPMTVDTSDLYDLLWICCKLSCVIYQQQIDQVEFRSVGLLVLRHLRDQCDQITRCQSLTQHPPPPPPPLLHLLRHASLPICAHYMSSPSRFGITTRRRLRLSRRQQPQKLQPQATATAAAESSKSGDTESQWRRHNVHKSVVMLDAAVRASNLTALTASTSMAIPTTKITDVFILIFKFSNFWSPSRLVVIQCGRFPTLVIVPAISVLGFVLAGQLFPSSSTQ